MKKTLIKHGIALIIFAAVGILYFYPAIQGYSPVMGDITNWKGMSKEIADYRYLYGDEPLWTNSMFGGMPAFQISVVYAHNVMRYIHQALSFIPRPIHYFFLYALGFYILLLTLKVDYRVAIIGALAYALSSYFIIILDAGHSSKAFAIGYMAPTIAGFILTYRGKVLSGLALFGLAMALELKANHVQITYYMGFVLLAYSLYAFIKALKEKKVPLFIRRSLLLGVVLIFAGLTNISSIYNTYVYGKLSTRGPSELTLKANGESNEDEKTSGLDRSYVTAWSYGKQESLSLFIPNVKGGSTKAIGDNPTALKGVDTRYRNLVAQNNQYWGDQSFTSGPVYVGVIVFFLFLLSLFTTGPRFKWVLLAVLLLALFLSWGKNLMWLTDFFLDFVPGYNKFRAVTIILVLVELLIPLMGFMYLSTIYSAPGKLEEKVFYSGKAYGKKFAWVAAGFGLILILLYLLPDTFLTFFSNREMDYFSTALNGNNANQVQASIDAIKLARVNIFRSDVLRSLAFLAGAVLVIYLYKYKTIDKRIMLGLLGLLLVLDLWVVDKRYYNNEKVRGKYVKWEKKNRHAYAHEPSKAALTILDRELNYNPAHPDLDALYQEALSEAKEKAQSEGLKGRISKREQQDIGFRTLNFNTDFRVLNVSLSTFNDASTSYFFKSIGGYHGAKLKIYQELIEFELQPEIQELLNRLKNGVKPHLAFEDMAVLNMLNTRYLIYNPDADPIENPNSLGNAWFVNEVKWVETPDEAILSVRDFNPAETAIMDQAYEEILKVGEFEPAPEDQIKLNSYLPNRLSYASNSKVHNLAVFSEIWYPMGWIATIDGKEVPILRVNYVLRGLLIPPGEHTIEFRFDPKGYSLANWISLVSGLLLLSFVGWVLVHEYRKRFVLTE